MSIKIKTVTEITTRMYSLYCPHCGAKQVDGWINDPRGKTIECDDCGEEYAVDLNPRVYIQ